MTAVNHSGSVFGLWTVIDRAPNRNGRSCWNCKCACGTVRAVHTAHLVSGASTNCGCSRPKGQQNARFKHGLSRHELFGTWNNIISRCENPNHPNYFRYGGRGISLCPRWRSDFSNFLHDMGERPSPQHTVERIDVNGNYEPSNCKWATHLEQMRNMRRNMVVTVDGSTKTLSEWSEITGIGYRTLVWRFKNGFPPERIIQK